MKNISKYIFLLSLLSLFILALANICAAQTNLQNLPPDVRNSLQEAVQRGAIPSSNVSQIENMFQEQRISEAKTQEVKAAAQAPEPAPAPISPPTKEYSKIEQQYRNGYASLLSSELRQFGYDIFRSATLRPSNLAVPDENYLLGPGDTLRIRIWGSEVDGEFVGTIAPDGTINVPKIGIIPVTGVRFGAAESVIRKEAEKYIQGININVSIEELRSVEVYIVGAVNNPGLQMVPAFSTVLGGLLVGGGVQNTGSLRSIELYRNGKLHKKIDLYDLLLKGDRDSDVVLTDRDVIFVPRLGRTAAVVGAVSEESIFELNREKTVGDLLALAGNVLPQGFTGRMHLRRYMDNAEFVVQDIDTSQDKSGNWRNIPVQDGDLLELKFLLSAWPQAIRLEGHVRQPDVFQYEKGLTLSRIITSSDLFMPGAVVDFAILHRYDPTTTRFQTKRFPLAEVLSGSYDDEVFPYDRIEILSRQEIGIKEEVSILGSVWNPGTYAFQPGITVADVMALAGGRKFGARVQQIEVSRQEIVDDVIKTKQIVLDFSKDSGFVLQPFDSVFVPQLKDATLQQKITLTGEVKYPGTYVIQTGDRLSDVIQRAGGFLPEAYFFGAVYTSEKAQQIQQESLDRLLNELEIKIKEVSISEAQTAVSQSDVESAKAAEAAFTALTRKLGAVKASGRVSIVLSDLESFRGTKYDFQLENGDSLHIPQRPSFIATIGSVYSPSAYLYEPNVSLKDYLSKSGGPTKTADNDYMYLLRANGEVVSKANKTGYFSSFESMKLMPGDTIVVPDDLERVPYLRLVRDISDIVFKIATTAGVAIAAL